LTNDFKVLEFEPTHADTVWDTADIPYYQKMGPDGKLQPSKLKNMAKLLAGNDIQKPSKIGHSPLEDARASMNLYRISLGYTKKFYANMSK